MLLASLLAFRLALQRVDAKLCQDIRTGSRGSAEEGDQVTCPEASNNELLPGEEVQVSAPGTCGASRVCYAAMLCWLGTERGLPVHGQEVYRLHHGSQPVRRGKAPAVAVISQARIRHQRRAFCAQCAVLFFKTSYQVAKDLLGLEGTTEEARGVIRKSAYSYSCSLWS